MSWTAALYAAVSASFIVEQPGLPVLAQTADETGTVREQWNGDLPQRRLEELQKRLGMITD